MRAVDRAMTGAKKGMAGPREAEPAIITGVSGETSVTAPHFWTAAAGQKTENHFIRAQAKKASPSPIREIHRCENFLTAAEWQTSLGSSNSKNQCE